MKKKYAELELSQVLTSLLKFLDSYNRGIPKEFPRASVVKLQKFRGLYPTLFKHGYEWSIAKHRKKFFDWLLVNQAHP